MTRTADQVNQDYKEFAGRCHELASAAVAADPALRLVRGWYHCPLWGKRQHWWCVNAEGGIHDPSVRQFVTAGAGAEYEEYIGLVECADCGKANIPEEDAIFNGNYAFCSDACAMSFVGL